jgi:hypothetical protein
MTRTPHEDRFVERMQFVVRGSEVAQELSIPRKARKLDMVCRFDQAPDYFQALRSVCSNRTVLFEHESQPLARHDVASAWVGLAWLLWERIRPPEGEAISDSAERRRTSRPPLVIIVADDAGDELTGAVPTLARTRRPGVWATARLDEGGLYVIDTSRVGTRGGFAFWSWIGRPPSEAEANRRLNALLGDRHLSIQSKSRLEVAIMSNELQVTATEMETVAQRLRREARLEGELIGERRGERKALLELAAQVAPERVAGLRSLKDLAELQAAVIRLVKGNG